MMSSSRRAVADRARAARCRPGRLRGCRAARGSPSGAHTRCSTKSRKSMPPSRSMMSASTQCAEVAWYSKRVPGSHSSSHSANVARRAAGSAPSISGITAFGKPAVCSITCSTVTASLPLAANSGTYSATGRVHVEQAVADQQPHRRRHDRLRAREDAVPGVVRRVAERLEGDQLAVAGDRQLARRQPAALHVGAREVEQLADRAHARRG